MEKTWEFNTTTGEGSESVTVVDEYEQDVRIEFDELSAVRVFADVIEVARDNGTTDIVAYGYMDDSNLYWRTVPMYIDGRLNLEFENYHEFSGLNIIS